jgi:hypothetical protein
MDLKKIAAKPQLERISIDDEHIVKEYGEPVEFYMWDRQSMNTYIRLSTIDPKNFNNIIEEVRQLVLDANGQRMLGDEDQLPMPVLLAVINAVVKRLGNSVSQTLAA